MKLIFCVDNALGLLFNHRRVSQDIAIREDLQQLTNHSTLYMDDYSFELFQDDRLTNIQVRADLPNPQLSGYQFIEQQNIPTHFQTGDELIIYYFNRCYPSDKKIPFDVNQSTHWHIQSVSPFVGQAHDKITRVIYKYD